MLDNQLKIVYKAGKDERRALYLALGINENIQKLSLLDMMRKIAPILLGAIFWAHIFGADSVNSLQLLAAKVFACFVDDF